MSDNSKKTVGLIGAGYWGKNILRNLHGLGVLRAVCDSSPNILDERRTAFPDIPRFTTSVSDILEDPAIHAVAIAAPAVLHADLAGKAISAGKDVFVEKPLALTVRDAERLIEQAERAQRVLMVGHILQYHPAVSKLKELVRSGALGQVRYIYSNRLNIGKIRTEENILWSFAPHDISVILSLLGEMPERVRAFGGDYVSRGIYDTTLTSLEFPSGVKGHIFVSWLHPYKEQKLIVVGSDAMAVFDDTSEEKLVVYSHKIDWQDGRIPVAHKGEYTAVPVAAGEPLRAELEHFLECVRIRETPRTDGHEGLRVLTVLQEAEDSLAERSQTPSAEKKPYFVHPTACVDDGAVIGEGSKIWHYSHVLGNTRLGRGCVLGQNVMAGPDVTLGDGCKVQNNVSLYKGVTLEDRVFCGPSCVFTNVYNPRAFIERKNEFLPTLVKTGATIGANATVVCGATIGRYAVVGAGAVVKNDVPDYALVVGVPARQIGWVCKCGVTAKGISEDSVYTCPWCGSVYRLSGGAMTVVEEKV